MTVFGRLEIGAEVSIGGEPIGVIIGLQDGNPILNLDGRVAVFSPDQFEAAPPVDAREFPIGTKVDSGLIRLFKRLNRGEVVGAYDDGMVLVRWDHEGECLQRLSELRKVTTIWEHLKHG